jgi:hypothetical protein
MLPGIILNCLSQCELTHRKRVRPVTKGVVVRPILSKEFSARGQVDLIDMQSLPHDSFKWIMVYQDHLTKFVVIRPLTSKRAPEVACQLMVIFLLFGAPHILQSDNGSNSVNCLNKWSIFYVSPMHYTGKFVVTCIWLLIFVIININRDET